MTEKPVAKLKIGRDVLTTGQISKLCGVASNAVKKWMDDGRLRSYRIPHRKNPWGERRATRESVIDFMVRHGMTELVQKQFPDRSPKACFLTTETVAAHPSVSETPRILIPALLLGVELAQGRVSRLLVGTKYGFAKTAETVLVCKATSPGTDARILWEGDDPIPTNDLNVPKFTAAQAAAAVTWLLTGGELL